MIKQFRFIAAALAAVALMLLGLAPNAVADITTATLDTTSTRTLTIHKYEGPANTTALCEPTGQVVDPSCLTGKAPLSGAGFTIYKVADLDTNEQWSAARAYYSMPQPIDPVALGWTQISNTADTDEVPGEWTTGADGTITVSFGTENALYYVVETTLPPAPEGSTYTGAVPFFVTVPMTMPNDTAWDYTIDVYPKNDLYEAPHKAVYDDNLTYNVGDPIDYRVSVTIPTYADVVGAPTVAAPTVYTGPDGTVNRWDIASYGILDVFSADLNYVGVASVRIFPVGVDPTTYGETVPAPTDIITLALGTDYNILTSDNADGTTSVYVNLLGPGLDQLAANPDKQLVVDYNTTIASVPAGGVIDNQAYTFPGMKPTPNTSIPTAPTTPPTPPTTPEEPGTPTNTVESKFGEIRIHKVGVTGTGATNEVDLAGAVFEVYQAVATQQADGTFTYSCAAADIAGQDYDPITAGQQPITTFTTTAGGIGESEMLRLSNWYNDGVELAVAPVVGNNDGYLDGAQYAEKYGYRNYCLVETQAPAGYQLLAEPILYSLTAEGDTTTVPVAEWTKIVNQEDNVGNELPLTGGEGIAALSLGGLALIGGGAAYYVVSRRRKVEA